MSCALKVPKRLSCITAKGQKPYTTYIYIYINLISLPNIAWTVHYLAWDLCLNYLSKTFWRHLKETNQLWMLITMAHSWNVPWARLDPGWDPHREITPEQTPIWSRLADSAHLPLGSARQRTICGRTPVAETSYMYGWLSGRSTWHSSRHGFITATISQHIKQWQGFSFSIWMLTNFPELSRRWLKNSIIYIIDWVIDNFILSCNRGAGQTPFPVFNVTFISISVWYTCQRVCLWKLSLLCLLLCADFMAPLATHWLRCWAYANSILWSIYSITNSQDISDNHNTP